MIEKIKIAREGGIEEFSAYLTRQAEERVGEIIADPYLKMRLLSIFDMLWMNHLEDMEALQESVRLRAYGQKDPLVEFRREAHGLFENLFKNFRTWTFENIFRLSQAAEISGSSEPVPSTPIPAAVAAGASVSSDPKFNNIGRNDPCPCGAKKPDGYPVKFKHCHGK